MFTSIWLPALLATIHVVSGLPTPDALPGDNDLGVKQIFARDAPLTPRDLELAQMHGADVAQMFKHSVIKRSNGGDVTIWVHQSFSDVKERDVDERSITVGASFASGGSGKNCQRNPPDSDWETFIDKTTAASPHAATVELIENWARTTPGNFAAIIPVDLVIAGTNSGAKARFSTRIEHAFGVITTRDVADITKTSLDRFRRQVGGAERVAAEGRTSCLGTVLWHPGPAPYPRTSVHNWQLAAM